MHSECGERLPSLFVFDLLRKNCHVYQFAWKDSHEMSVVRILRQILSLNIYSLQVPKKKLYLKLNHSRDMENVYINHTFALKMEAECISEISTLPVSVRWNRCVYKRAI
jgi:hypothetical protein